MRSATRWVGSAAARLRSAADERVSGASLAVFRIVFGAVTAFVACRWIAYGWVDALLVDPPIHFTYPGFHWVRPLPSVPMHLVVALIAVAGVSLSFGYRFRLAATSIALGMAYVQLIDQTLYINHYYWMILTAGVLATSPAHRTWSLDARRRPAVGDGTVPRRWVWGLRAQVGMVYVFAGIAKIGTDWLLNAQPLSIWLPARADMPIIGPLLQHRETAYVMSWAGAVFDLTIVAWLLWPRSRPYAFAGVVVFHVATWRLFPSIGAFPWPMIAGATMFFSPDWPRQVAARVRRTSLAARISDRAFRTRQTRARPQTLGPPSNASKPPRRISGFDAGNPAASTAHHPLAESLRPKPTRPPSRGKASTASTSPRWRRRLMTAAAVTYMAAMVLIPLRHIPMGTDIMLAGSDYRFGWRVMLTERTGIVSFAVTDPVSGTTWIEQPPPDLTPRQREVMAADPALIHRTALILASQHLEATGQTVIVRPLTRVAFNGRPSSPYIDAASPAPPDT